MSDRELTYLERECWRRCATGAAFGEIGQCLGISGSRVKYEIYGAAAKLIRRWQMRLPRGMLRRVLSRKNS